MARDLKPIVQNDFSGGVNLVVNPYLIAQKQIAEGTDLWLDEHGSLRTRGGVLNLSTSPNVFDPIYHRGLLSREDGNEFPFVIQKTNGADTNTLWRTDLAPWSNIGTFGVNELLPHSFTVNDVAFFVPGYVTPKTWDGTTFANITGQAGQTVPPGAKHAAFHLGAVWLWNTAAVSAPIDGPSSLRMSGPNDITDWPTSNQTFIGKGDGQEGMGMSSFTIVETGISPTATLVLFKNYSAYQVTGVFGSDNFSIQPIKTDMGCVAPRTIQFVAGFGIIRLTHKGFALYNGVEDRLISEEVRPAIFGDPETTGLDFTTLRLSWAAQNPNPPLYVAACPVEGASLTRLFIYDLIRRGWTLCTLPTPVSTMSLYLTTGEFPSIHAGTFFGGKLQQLFATNQFTDNGSDIGWSMETKSYFVQNQVEPAFWRRAQVQILGQPGYFVQIQPVVDGNVRESKYYRFPPVTGPELVEAVFSRDIRETAHNVRLRVSGKGRAYIRGVELQASAKPITKWRTLAS